jgi:hypothetical protein
VSDEVHGLVAVSSRCRDGGAPMCRPAIRHSTGQRADGGDADVSYAGSGLIGQAGAFGARRRSFPFGHRLKGPAVLICSAAPSPGPFAGTMGWPRFDHRRRRGEFEAAGAACQTPARSGSADGFIGFRAAPADG